MEGHWVDVSIIHGADNLSESDGCSAYGTFGSLTAHPLYNALWVTETQANLIINTARQRSMDWV